MFVYWPNILCVFVCVCVCVCVWVSICVYVICTPILWLWCWSLCIICASVGVFVYSSCPLSVYNRALSTSVCIGTPYICLFYEQMYTCPHQWLHTDLYVQWTSDKSNSKWSAEYLEWSVVRLSGVNRSDQLITSIYAVYLFIRLQLARSFAYTHTNIYSRVMCIFNLARVVSSLLLLLLWSQSFGVNQ